MDLQAWIGLLLIVLCIGAAYLRVRRKRHSGHTTSFGHPVLDSALLLIAGLILASALVLALLIVRSSHPDWLRDRMIGYPLVILVGGGLTWLCSRVLRGTKRG